MSALRFATTESLLEIDLAAWDGDAYVSVVVESHGYRGRNDLHVHSAEFNAFCRALIALQQSLKVVAHLVGVVPEELDIVFRPADSRGHISISGRTGYEIESNWHEVRFGFVVEPSLLDQIPKNEWVRKHAV